MKQQQQKILIFFLCYRWQNTEERKLIIKGLVIELLDFFSETIKTYFKIFM